MPPPRPKQNARVFVASEHPNISLLSRFDPANMAGAADVFGPEVVWHFFNPLLPDVQGDYVGLAGVRSFFEKMAALTNGTFEVEPIFITACGDELVVAQTRNRMRLGGRSIETDVVTVWRIVDGRIAEVWDIPSVHTLNAQTDD